MRITAVHGLDRFERQVVDLAVDGDDVASAGLAASLPDHGTDTRVGTALKRLLPIRHFDRVLLERG